MGLWDRLMGFVRPTNYVAGEQYKPFFGMSNAGKYVTPRSSMQIAAVQSCVRLISGHIAAMPLNVYEYAESGTKRKAFEHPLNTLLHDAPNAEMSSFNFRESLMCHLLVWGNAYAQVIRNYRGEVVSLYPLQPDRVRPDRDEDGNLFYRYNQNSGDHKTDKDNYVILKGKDILHIPGMGFDGIVGYSPIAYAKNTMGTGLACDEYGNKFYANGATLSGVLEHPGVLKEPKKLRDSWQAAYGGSANSHKTAVLEEGMKYHAISVTPNDAQFLETKKFTRSEIAGLFGVPPHMIGDLERATFSNIEHQSIEFAKYTLYPWVTRIEQAMSRILLSDEERKKYAIKFNLDSLLRGDYQSRMAGYAQGIQNGFLSPNDVRALEDMDLIPEEKGGNRYMINGSMTPLDKAGAAYQQGVPSQERGEDG